MIISHKFKYIFVALPRTGSNAIKKELKKYYLGEEILSHHALYRDFIKIASPEEKKYKVIMGIRNPLDCTVSSYYKYLSDHRNIYGSQKFYNLGRMRKYVRYYLDGWRYRYVALENSSFDSYLLKFYKFPYSNWSILDKERVDFFLRYETLSEDFSKFLEFMGIDKVRDLPIVNRTEGRPLHFIELYSKPETIIRAKKVFAAFMKQWGYSFPKEWDGYPESKFYNALFPASNFILKIYWCYLR